AGGVHLGLGEGCAARGGGERVRAELLPVDGGAEVVHRTGARDGPLRGGTRGARPRQRVGDHLPALVVQQVRAEAGGLQIEGPAVERLDRGAAARQVV